MDNVREPVRLRQRVRKDGSRSLYLDIYYKGHRRYEYLRMYLVAEHCREDRERNRATLSMAETVRAQRVVSLRNKVYGFSDGVAAAIHFFAYYAEQMARRRGATLNTWRACLSLLHGYERRDILLGDIDARWVEGFKAFLCGRALKTNTRALYFSVLRTCLHAAVADGVLPSAVLRGVGNIREEEVERAFLTATELRLLSSAYGGAMVCRAFLFSCLTGLRWSDVYGLSWREVQDDGECCRVVFMQHKTRGLQYLDLSAQALALLGARGGGRCFVGLPSLVTVNKRLGAMCRAVGITKHITFHCGRHTFAVLLLDAGVDIYTVSKLLGHHDLSTTQVYAKVLDKNRRAAVEKLPHIL